MELSQGLYSYLWQGQGNNCNTYAIRYIVDGKSNFALIDPGHISVMTPSIDSRTGRVREYYEEDALKELLKAMEKDGIKISNLSLIVFTHCHPDHCQAGIALAGMGTARIAFHELEMPRFQGLLKKLPVNGEDLSTISKAELPDFFLREGEMVLGSPAQVVIDILHTPGHSPGSISLYWGERKALFAGDVVFHRNTGRYDLHGGSRSVLRESIVKLSHLDVECLLTGHPYGHPGVITGKKEVELNFSFILTHVLP